MFHVADSLEESPHERPILCESRTCSPSAEPTSFARRGPVNHFVKWCFFGEVLSAVQDSMPTVFTTACRIWRPYFFGESEVLSKAFDAAWSCVIIIVVQCCTLGPFGRRLHSTEEKVLGFCSAEQWIGAQEYKFEKSCSVCTFYGSSVYFFVS